MCAPTSEDFLAERTSFIDDNHRKLVHEIRAPQRAAATVARAKDTLRRRAAAEAKGSSVNAAILQVELLHLDQDLPNAEKLRLRKNILKSLGKETDTPAAVEAFAAFSLLNNEEDAGRLTDLQRSALAKHRRLFGEVPRQFLIWVQLYKRASGDEQLAIAREVLSAAEKMANPPILFQARAGLFRHLSADAPERRQLAEAISADTAGVARHMPTASQSTPPSCYEAVAAFTSEITSAFTITGKLAERKSFIKAIVHYAAKQVTFGTHAQFVLQDVSRILAARAVDFEAYLSAIASIEAADPGCAEPKRPAVIWAISCQFPQLLRHGSPPRWQGHTSSRTTSLGVDHGSCAEAVVACGTSRTTSSPGAGPPAEPEAQDALARFCQPSGAIPRSTKHAASDVRKAQGARCSAMG